MRIDSLSKKLQKLPKGVSRIQSPSSINTWKQCPRKYWYHYIADLPTKPSIYLIRGSVIHLALEKFFDTDVALLPDDKEQFFFTLKIILQERFEKEWEIHREELSALPLSNEELKGFYDQSIRMLINYFDYFTDKTSYYLRLLPLKEAWDAVKPTREMEFSSEEHQVHGFIDAIHNEAGKTLILDYKTSRRAHMSPEYRLQLAIYALLYQERFRTPDMVGIYFLNKGKEVLLDVTPEMIEWVKQEIKEAHLGTMSKEIDEYPKRPGHLCKWSTGQCDYYKYCFEGEPLPHPSDQ